MSISYRPLGPDASGDALARVAGLIYDTDPYIYPAMFRDRGEAVALIPKMIRAGDAMFRPENLFVAELDGEVVGLILWARGPMRWSADVYRAAGGTSPHMARVEREYFAAYADTPPGRVSLINVCVDARRRGRGLASGMLDAFLRDVRDPCELFVLADNDAAIRLYRSKGFAIARTQQGFCLEPRALPCHQMVRPADSGKSIDA